MFEKLREAALAYHLTHEWPKQKILTEYLNSIYFGNGAYGIESAARVYFGKELGYDPSSASEPSGGAATRRPAPRARRSWRRAGGAAGRDGRQPIGVRPDRLPAARRIGAPQPGAAGHVPAALHQPLPVRPGHRRAAADRRRTSSSPRSRRRRRTSRSWLRTADPRRRWARRASRPGRRVPRLLRRAEDPHHDRPADAAGGRAGDLAGPALPVPTSPPRHWWRSTTRPARSARWSAARSSTARRTSQQYPFNLATEGFRQPGSAFKPFTLAVALEHGYGPELGVRLPRRWT